MHSEENERRALGHGHCKTCKCWTPFTPSAGDEIHLQVIAEQQAEGEDVGQHRGNVYVMKRMGLCDRFDNRPGNIRPDALALADDLSSHATLRTAAEFGCVQWKWDEKS